MFDWLTRTDFFRRFMVLFMSACGVIASLFEQGYTREMTYDTDVSNALFSVHGTDSCDREVTEVADMNDNKYVGMFYFLWLGYTTPESSVYDITKISGEGGLDKLLDINDNTYQLGAYYFWDKPLYGYYNSADRWVIMKHMKLLTSAGVDFIVLDTTNAATYDNVVKELISVILELQSQGFNPPQIAYYTNTDSAKTVKHLYDEMYFVSEYDSAWFKIDGKPMIVADVDELDASDMDYVYDYFYVKDKNWPNSKKNRWNSFPWLSWQRPQKVWGDKYLKNGIINVSVAQHPDGKMSASLTDRTKNWGRGFTTESGVNDETSALSGANFQEQWDYAISQDVDMVFVTGWNEWIAGRYKDGSGEIMFCDTASMEFSRDCEMMSGGYGDNFYMQLAENIRAFKGTTSGSGSSAAEVVSKAIDIDGPLSQWNGSTSFRCFTNDVFNRNSIGAFNSLHYSDDSGRNDISSVAVTNDDDNIYVKVETAKSVTPYAASDTTWMNLLLGYKGYGGNKFSDYGFVINRSNTDGYASLEKISGSGYQNVGSVKLSVKENDVCYEIPRGLIGLSEKDFTLYIKACDHVAYDQNGTLDYMEFYISGDSAPMGRMSYSVSGK